MTGEEGETADIDWIRKNLGFVDDPNRICVGITRSKFGLVIVGECFFYSYSDFMSCLMLKNIRM